MEVQEKLEFTHLDDQGNAVMVDVCEKKSQIEVLRRGGEGQGEGNEKKNFSNRNGSCYDVGNYGMQQ